jgi:hypothetical protein
MQLDSRRAEELLQIADAGEEWVELRKGSINGFYNVVVSLGWWIQATMTAPELAEVTRMLKDAIWVVDQMLSTIRKGKRGPDNDDPLTGHSDKR